MPSASKRSQSTHCMYSSSSGSAVAHSAAPVDVCSILGNLRPAGVLAHAPNAVRLAGWGSARPTTDHESDEEESESDDGEEY